MLRTTIEVRTSINVKANFERTGKGERVTGKVPQTYRTPQKFSENLRRRALMVPRFRLTCLSAELPKSRRSWRRGRRGHPEPSHLGSRSRLLPCRTTDHPFGPVKPAGRW